MKILTIVILAAAILVAAHLSVLLRVWNRKLVEMILALVVLGASLKNVVARTAKEPGPFNFLSGQSSQRLADEF